MRFWRERDPSVPVVVNANRPTVNLAPASDAPVNAVRAGWAPLLTGQLVPRVGEGGVADA